MLSSETERIRMRTKWNGSDSAVECVPIGEIRAGKSRVSRDDRIRAAAQFPISLLPLLLVHSLFFRPLRSCLHPNQKWINDNERF